MTTTPRAAYFVSDSTGITAETLGRALLVNFPGVSFRHHTVPFVDSAEGAAALASLKDDLVAWLHRAELLRGSRGGTAAPRKDQLIKNALEFDAPPTAAAGSGGTQHPRSIR